MYDPGGPTDPRPSLSRTRGPQEGLGFIRTTGLSTRESGHKPPSALGGTEGGTTRIPLSSGSGGAATDEAGDQRVCPAGRRTECAALQLPHLRSSAPHQPVAPHEPSLPVVCPTRVRSFHPFKSATIAPVLPASSRPVLLDRVGCMVPFRSDMMNEQATRFHPGPLDRHRRQARAPRQSRVHHAIRLCVHRNPRARPSDRIFGRMESPAQPLHGWGPGVFRRRDSNPGSPG